MTDETLTGAAATFVAARPAGHLATVSATGQPHVIPVCYAWDGTDIWIALDAKPKLVADVTQLQRVRNILAHPQATLAVDDYLDDWSQLAHVLIAGTARLVFPSDVTHAPAIALLRAKYVQYATMPIAANPAIALRPTHVVSWGAVATRAARPASLEATVTGRRSVRRFATTLVTREQIGRVIDAAGWAPSPHGRQPWRFKVVTQQATKDRLAAAMGDEWEATLAQDDEPPEIVARRLEQSRLRIRTAPAIIVPCLYADDLDHYPDVGRQQAETTMAIQSLGAAIQNMLLTAYHDGLDMGWMCAPLFCQGIVQHALDLPSNWQPQALLPLGYVGAAPKRRPHRPTKELTHWDG